MKSKPTAHKASNTYKFETFHERLEKINISTISHLKRRFDTDESDENVSFFAIALEKWSDLNCTQDYKDIQQCIGSNLYVQSLVQIIHRKRELMQILTDGLKVEDSKALNAILELIVALARDLQSEFYDFFSTVFELVVDLTCQATEVETIEALFICQTFLFKYLWKYILKDIEKHFDIIKKSLTSKKEHVINFSSEVFSFLIKKSKHQEEVIQLLFHRLEADSSIDKAIGRIFFESVKGVNRNFHSKAKELLDLVFSKFVNSPSGCFAEMMSHFVTFLLNYSTKDSFKIIWHYLLLDSSKFSVSAICQVAPLIKQAVVYRRGKLLYDSSLALTILTDYLSKHRFERLVTGTLLDSIESILNNCDSELSLEKVNYFCEYFYISAYYSLSLSLDQIFTFTKSICCCSTFDITFNRYCCKLSLDVLQCSSSDVDVSMCLQFLAHLIVKKRPRPVYGDENGLISKYLLQFEANEGRSVEEILLEQLKKCTDLNSLLFCVIVIPHLPSLSSDEITCQSISSSVLEGIESFSATDNKSDCALVGQLLFEMIVALVLLKNQKYAIDEISSERILDLVKLYPHTIEFLQSLDVYLSYNKAVKPQFLTPSSPLLPLVYPILPLRFSSSRRLDRILSLHIVTLFDLPLPPESKQLEEHSRKSVFEICLQAELINPELAQYRERLMYVRKLDSNLVSCHVPQRQANLDFDAAPVFYLLGSLYENLNLLWKPTIEVLGTYSQLAKDRKQLMSILFEHFQRTNEHILSGSTANPSPSVYEQLLDIKSASFAALSSLPDHYNHRVLLLNTFESFSAIVEPRNREFIELFFAFVQGEMKSRFVYLASYKENLKNRDDEEYNEEETDECVKSSDLKFQWRTFFAFLSILAKFKNPKAIYRENELNQMYLNLLVSPNPALQRFAMKCLFTYNHSYLAKYKDNFVRLLEEKTFSTEIHTFVQHDTEVDNAVSDDDRAQLMPIFLRLLYGKLLASSGTKVHGKSKIDFLRSLILKVIAGFTEADQLMFMDLIFASLEPLIITEYATLSDAVAPFVSVESFFLPFKQFNSLMATLECLMKHFGSKSLPVMQRMLKVLLVCSSVCNHLLSPSNRVQLKPYIANLLRAFRTNCFKTAQYFFINFDRYPFTPDEIDAFFEVLVQPLLANLQTESLDSPSPLLRLLRTWSENARYYILLAKQVEADTELTPLLAIIQLYSQPKISSTSVTFITSIIENLLTFDGDKAINEETIGMSINVNNFGKPLSRPAVVGGQSSGESVSFGSFLLIPHLKAILDRIYANYATKIANNSKFEFTLQEVNILARLSFFVEDPTDSAAFSTLLLHSISQTRRPDEPKEVFTLKTLNHLARNILEKDFRKLLHLAFPLFQLINRPLSRRELCTFVLTLCQKNALLQPLIQLIGDINSYDVRLPEEPDFDRRITGFKKIMKEVEKFDESIPSQLDFIHLLLENCAFMINTYDDMSLKDLSSTVIIKICHVLADCKKSNFDCYVMNIIFYKLISNGLRHAKESTRHEWIGVLVSAAKVFSHRHEIVQQLRDLSMDEEKNEEIDFWLNIKHIQLHRRARALNRLSQDESLLSRMAPRVFTSFLIPLVNSFIGDPLHYSKNISLYSAAVDSLATFLQYCSWSKYDSTLTSYIHRLLNHSTQMEPKLVIRIISAILAKFSFLKPDEVAQIEKDLKADDIKSMSLEYSVARKQKKAAGKGGKFGKKKKFGKKEGQQKTDRDDNQTKTKSHLPESIEATENPANTNPEESIEPEDVEESEMAVDRSVQAHKIYQSLCRKLLPLLHKCLHQRSQIEYMHDSRDYKDHEFAEDEEIQRIPIALAIVKLLAHVQINKQLFQANVTSIFLRLCQFLQSRADSIREASRSILVQVMQTLGPQYFNEIFYEMRALLARGYQRHIFIYTVYLLMSNLTSQLNGGDLDRCMKDIIEMCHQEMFGSLAEEKEVSHITSKTKEAKKLKSYDIYEILAQFVSKSALPGLLNPLKEVLLESSSHKVVKKVESAFFKICRGLVTNRFLTVQSLVPTLLNILSTTEPDVVGTASDGKQNGKIMRLTEKLPSKLDSFLIPAKSLRRVHQVSKINRTSNLYVMSDFALTCFISLLKNNRLVASEASHFEMLEPAIEYNSAFLHSKDTKVITSSLQCIHSLLVKFPELNSFKQLTPQIISQIFVLLKKYTGLSSDNTQLVALCFKTIAHFINTRSDCKLNNEEIAVLISYAENDIENNAHNSSIYLILKSIIKRKFVSKELHQLMEKLLVLAITTDVDHMRNHAIELSVKYLTEYPIDPPRFKGKMVKLVRQIEYKTISGRIAAVTILKSAIGLLNSETLAPLKETLFLPIASRFVNEESAECKKLISATVLTILSKLDVAERNNLFDTFIEPWLACEDILVLTLASHLCTQLVKHEKHHFESRLAAVLPLVRQQLDPSRFASLTQSEADEETFVKHRNEDNLIFQHLTFVLTLLQLKTFNDSGVNFSMLEILTKAKYFEDFNTIFGYITSDYILHPHSWIRCLATQIFGQMFSLWSEPQAFVQDGHLYKNTYLFQDLEEVFCQLCDKFCLVFRDIYNCPTVAEQLMKNLVYIARVMIELDGQDQTNENNAKRKISLRRLLNKLLFEVKFEVKSCPENYQKRILLAKWIAAVIYALYGEEEKRKDRLEAYLPNLLPPLCREELSNSAEEVVDPEVKRSKEELALLHRQVHDMLKARLGAELYHDYYNRVRNEISHKKLERRKIRAIQMINQTDVGVKRKLRKHKRDRLAIKNKRRKKVR